MGERRVCGSTSAGVGPLDHLRLTLARSELVPHVAGFERVGGFKGLRQFHAGRNDLARVPPGMASGSSCSFASATSLRPGRVPSQERRIPCGEIVRVRRTKAPLLITV